MCMWQIDLSVWVLIDQSYSTNGISVAIAYASSHEIAQALGMSVATDPRGQ